MVVAYVGGKPVETLSDEALRFLAHFAAMGEVEFRGEDGTRIGQYVPAAGDGYDPSWEEMTEEEVQRRIAEPGAMTLREFWKKMGVE